MLQKSAIDTRGSLLITFVAYVAYVTGSPDVHVSLQASFVEL